MNQLPDGGKEGIKQVGQIIREIVSRLNNQPTFLFGIASMLLAVVVFVVLAGFSPSNQAMNWFPYALLFFGLALILISYFRSEKLEQSILSYEKDEPMSSGLKIPDGVGGLFSGAYKIIYISEKHIGKLLNITVESSDNPLCIELWQTAFDGADVNKWLSKRKHIHRSSVKSNPKFNWKISQAGEYTVYFVAHSKEGNRANYSISYQIEVTSG